MAVSKPEPAEGSWVIPRELRLQLVAALASQGDTRPQMSWEDFHDWADEDTGAEWVDGEVIMPSPVGLKHQDIANFLVGMMAGYARLHDLGRVANAPFMMKLERAAREPDVLFVARDHLDRLKPTYLDGPADLVVEIISPESRGRDRGDKFFEYEAARIPEYWLLDPDTLRAEFYQLDERGHYQLAAHDDLGRYHSRTLKGLWLRVTWLWQDELPAVDDALLEIAGEAYARHLLDQIRQRGLMRGQ